MEPITAINLFLTLIILIFALIVLRYLLNRDKRQNSNDLMNEAYAGLRGPPPGYAIGPSFGEKD